MLNKKGGVDMAQGLVVKKSRWWVWLIVVLLVLVLGVGSYFLFFGDEVSGDKEVVRDAIYEMYVSGCDVLDDGVIGECKDAAECIADGFANHLNDEEVREFVVLWEDSGVEKALREIMEGIERDRIELINKEIFPCSEKMSDIVTEHISSELDSGMGCLDAMAMIYIESSCKDDRGVHITLTGASGDLDIERIRFVFGENYAERDFREGDFFVTYSELGVDSVERVVVAPIVSGKTCDVSGGGIIEAC